MRHRFWTIVERVADRLDDLAESFWVWARDKAERNEDEGDAKMATGGLTHNINISFTTGRDTSAKPKLPNQPEPTARASTSPVRAYRQWKLVFESAEPYLQSIVADALWEGPILRANHKPHFHTRPGDHRQLGHGIYAYPLVSVDMGSLFDMNPFTWLAVDRPACQPSAEGEVELMGRVVRHERGYRAETARIVRLFIRDLPGHYDREDVIRRMEARYQCEVSMMPLYDPERLRASQPDDEPKPPADTPNEPAGYSTVTGFLRSSLALPAPTIKLIGGP